MYKIYKTLTTLSIPLLIAILNKRCKAGKELPSRVQEKRAIISKPRPSGKLIWIHAASVGEAQSTLVLIDKFLEQDKTLNIMVTTGTVTSARIMDEKLPAQAFHQFYPLDHPKWVATFLNHWQPDGVLWMESELWANMLCEIKARNIPAILVNARMSQSSFNSWKRFKSLAKTTLSAFDKILCQTENGAKYFTELGAKNVIVTDNLKYSARALNYDEGDLKNLATTRPLWLYASTHKGEEDLACRAHIELKEQFPNLLTIIVPRHPDRREEIAQSCDKFDLNIKFRGSKKDLPEGDTDIYIADTLGELGLFYRLAPLACIGRSFSDDGGGGHNPIEAAQLGCAVIHGKNIQNLQDIFDEMDGVNAAICMDNAQELAPTIKSLLNQNEKLLNLQNAGKQYSKDKNNVIEKVMLELKPILSI